MVGDIPIPAIAKKINSNVTEYVMQFIELQCNMLRKFNVFLCRVLYL